MPNDTPPPAERRRILREAKHTAAIAVRVKVRDVAADQPRTKRARLAPVGRAKRESQGEVFGPQADTCRTLNCVSCGAAPTPLVPVDPHHEPPVAQGGLDPDTVPLCRRCHERRGTMSAENFWGGLQLDPRDVQQAVRDYMEALARGEAVTVAWTFTDGERKAVA